MTSQNDQSNVTNLLVPFEEKDEVKKLGARWNVEKKSWYVPQGLDLTPFKRWLPPPLKANGQYDDKPTVRAKCFWIVENIDDRTCWKCKEGTSVFAFFVPSDHEVLNDISGQWERAGHERYLSNITYLGENAVRAIGEHATEYKIDFHHKFYWLNHCQECDALLSDWYDHNEPDGAFMKHPQEIYDGGTTYFYDLPFEAGEDG